MRYAPARFSLVAAALAAAAFATVLGCGDGEGGELTEPQNQPPVASFTANPTDTLAPIEVTFDASASYDPDGEIQTFFWDYGDGTSEDGADFMRHEYLAPGTYEVTLTVSDDFAATASHSDTLHFEEGVLWIYEAENPIAYSAPVVGSDGTIYFGTGIYLHTDRGALHALNPDGTLKWRQDLDLYPNTQYPTGDNGYSPVLGSDGTIYIQGATSALYAFDAAGNRKWKYVAYDEYPFASAVGQRVPAIGDDGTLYVPADALYAINPDGTRKWRFPTSWGPQGMPVIGPDGTIYITGGQDNLWAVNPDGTQKWLFKLVVGSEKSFGSPAIDADGTIYVPAEDGDKGYLYAINPDGQQRWRYAVQGAGRALRSSPAIAPDGTIYVGTKFGDPAAQMLALNPDGTIKWTLDVEPVVEADDIYCSPTIGADGTIYFGAETGFFYAVDAAGNLKWSIKLNGGNVWSSPALLDDGTLYFGNVGLSWEGEWYGYLFAVQTNSPGLAASPWPKFRRNNRNTGR